MKSRRSQAAMEFLTTYGWAFMTIMVMIGAIAYFGITDPATFLPEKCFFGQNIVCEDYQLDGQAIPGEAKFDIRQNFGETVVLENVTCDFRQGSYTFTPGDTEWTPKETINVICEAPGGPNLISGEKEKVEVLITYKFTPSGYDHYAEGEVYANVI